MWPRFVPLLLGDDPRGLKNPALEAERVIVRRVIRSAQFHASDPPLDVRVVDALHLRMDDSIAQILLAVLPEVLAARFHLAYEDRSRLQIADPLEQLEEILARVFESRHDLEDRQRIDDEDVVVQGPIQVHDVHLENLEPRAVRHPVQVAADHAEVDDADFVLHIPRTQTHLIQVARQVVSPLFQRDIGARPPIAERVLVDHVERDRGLHRPRLSREKDDVPLGDSAPELVVKPVDERSDTVSLAHCKAFHWKERVITVPRPLSPGASRARMEGKQKKKGEEEANGKTKGGQGKDNFCTRPGTKGSPGKVNCYPGWLQGPGG